MSLLRNSSKLSMRLFRAVLVVLFFVGQSQSFAADRTVELKIKAAYLYNFLKFVQWSDSNLAADQSEIIICVLGQNQLGPFLAPMVEMKAQGRNIRIITLDDLSQIRDCQLLFISDSETRNLEQIMTGLQGVDYLTVGEAEGFAARGGMIGFVMKEDKVKLEINIRAAKLANVRISAKLLEVAEIVQ